jgi:hypothetical protein
MFLQYFCIRKNTMVATVLNIAQENQIVNATDTKAHSCNYSELVKSNFHPYNLSL